MVAPRGRWRHLAGSAALVALTACPRPAPEGGASGGGDDGPTPSVSASSGPPVDAQATSTASGPATSAGGGSGDGGATGSGGADGGGGEGGGGGGACPEGEIECGRACRDATSDPSHCGGCDHDCMGGACDESACEPVLLHEPPTWTLSAVAAYAGRLWWVEAQSPLAQSEIRSVPEDAPPGAPSALTTVAGYYAARLSFTSTHVYWVENAGEESVDGIYRAPLVGRAAPELVSTCLRPRAAVPAGPTWIVAVCFGERAVARVDVDTGERVPLATGLEGPVDVAVDETFAYFLDVAQNDSRGDVVRVALDGLSAPETLAVDVLDAERIARTGDRVIFTGRLGLYALDAAGGLQEPEQLSAGGNAASLAIDGGSAFWISRDDFTVHASVLDTGEEQTWSAEGEVFEVAASPRAVFWANAGFSGVDGLFRLAR